MCVERISAGDPSVLMGSRGVADFTCIIRDHLMGLIKTKAMVVLTEFTSPISSDVFSFILCHRSGGG